MLRHWSLVVNKGQMTNDKITNHKEQMTKDK